MPTSQLLPLLLALAWLLPLAAFAYVWLRCTLPQLAGGEPPRAAKRFAGVVAIAAVAGSFLLSFAAFGVWLSTHSPTGEHAAGPPPITGDYYTLATFGDLRLSIDYYIDSLTVLMFVLVTLISGCVHYYATGYLHEELDEVEDHEVATKTGEYLHRPGRYHRFFQYLSLFTFSMLGIVLAGNLAMVFVFWELVGVCSYFLIGFYFERPAANRAASKAFIVNRIGDVGMLVGIMALWGSLGTLQFGDTESQAGLFSSLAESPTPISYPLLFAAGLGLFAGCVGKSAQFPLHTWLPDAMEGPTPVSALVHSATMVAAGVYLVGRCYPIFVPEVLLTIAIVGAITLLLAASMALVAVDIKRVLAYSTVSQLGFMMLAVGLGGWVAGLFHLVTHACFKSLLFLCSGSVIHAVGTNDMRLMGGLRHKMPWTAYTMLIGCLAIVGAGIPVWGVGFSGFFSKDAIVEQAWSFASANPSFGFQFLLWIPLAGAFLTACYMFRLWYLTFTGEPRDAQRYAAAHESPRSMVAPLVLLAGLAVVVGWNWPLSDVSVANLLHQSQPEATHHSSAGQWLASLTTPAEDLRHAAEIAVPASWVALLVAACGVLVATLVYVWHWLRADELCQSFKPIHTVLWHKWWFDELYDRAFVKPTLWLSLLPRLLDAWFIDPLVNGTAWLLKQIASAFDTTIDRGLVDGSIDRFARGTFRLGNSLRRVQTGSLRQYVMFLVVGTLSLFAVASVLWKYTLAG